jgi:hypothetical protein
VRRVEMSRQYDTFDDANQPQPDDGFHDHALSELYRAADDLSPWYSAAELGELLAVHARQKAREAVLAFPATTVDPFDGRAA